MVSTRRVVCAAASICLLTACNRVVPPSSGEPAEDAVSSVASAIRALVADGEREQLAALYAPAAYAPLWVDATLHPTPDGRDALALLAGAAADGLDPADYDAARLTDLAAVLQVAHGRPLVADVAAFDTGLSASTLRFLRHLHIGRIDPGTIGFRIAVRAEEHNFPGVLRAAIAGHRLGPAAAALAPPLPIYRGLRVMLARYRALATDPTLDPLPQPAVTVRPGGRYASSAPLWRRLVAFGDLPADSPLPGDATVYGGALVAGVKHFQARHGLQADGVLGRTTQAALAVPLSWRVRQIELALERLRWLPDLGGGRLLAVNIPMFRLWGWEAIGPEGTPSFGTGVIVGRALGTETPVFVEEMRYLIFRPYWNVPPSILRREILPILARDPGYLARQDMEIVSGAGDNGRQVPLTAESLALLRLGRLRVRQRPGPTNALGLVKFVFPNDANVYLHATPASELFARDRRDFSHGCVRVEDSVGLAEWVLKDQPEWTRDKIVAAMHADGSRRVNLARPIQVFLFYITAVVTPEDGAIRFADDIYGHDVRLDRALTRRQTTQRPA